MSSQSTLWEKVSGFVAKHKAAVIVGSAVVVGSGAGAYYYYTLTADNGKPAGKKPKKLSKQDKKKLKKAHEETKDTLAGFNLIKDENLDVEYPQIADFAPVKELPEEDRKKIANQFKLAGNDAFSKKNYEKAISLYTNALECAIDPIFYSNRAACYSSLQQYDKVIEDTSAALELKPDYQKCLARRATTYEKLQNYSEAVLDYTSVMILSNLHDAGLNASLDRALKAFAEKRALEIYETREKKLPSPATVAAFFQSFQLPSLPEGIASPPVDSGDHDIKLAIEALATETTESYNKSFELFNSAIEKKAEHASIAYAYRAVFNFLISDTAAATEDVKESIDLNPSSFAYIIRANLSMGDNNATAASLDYESAIKANPDDSSIYFHRAQLEFMLGKLSDAKKDYEKCIELHPEFVLAHIQLATSYYRDGDIPKAMEIFKTLLHSFPNSEDVHNYYGEILADQQQFTAAIEQFDEAVKVHSNSALNVLPLVNKAMALFQSQTNIPEAVHLLMQAVQLDPLSDVANATLAQVYMQTQQSEEAYKCMLKSVELARTVPEMVQHLCIAEATRTQLRLRKERPFLVTKLDALQAQAASQR